MITPEEMAIADVTIDPKLLKYVSLIKWASENSRSKKHQNESNNEQSVKITSFSVKGSGVVSGVIGKKTRFSLTVSDVVGMFHLGIDIKGPKNEVYSEEIISLRQSKEIMIGAYQTQPKQGRFASIDNHVMEYMEDGVGNTYVRWKNLKLLGDSSMVSVIPFNCQCTGEGTFQMTYLPISTGIHTVSIKWQNLHINGSPFKVKIYQPRDITRRAIKDAKDKRIIFESLSLSSIEERPFGLLKIKSEDNVNGRNQGDSEMPGRKSSRSTRIRKQFTVTKRRVIRKVISRHGEEIVIQESPSPTLSRQSSMTDTSTEEEQIRKPCSPSPLPSRNIIPQFIRTNVVRDVRNEIPDGGHKGLQQGPTCLDHNGKCMASNNCDIKDIGIEKKNDIQEDTSKSKENAKASWLCKRSLSDSTLSNTPSLGNQQITFPERLIHRNDTDRKRFHAALHSLKVLQSDSFKKSCYYFSNELFRQYSFSSTSSASSNSNSSLGKMKKNLTMTRSLPILKNNVYPYSKRSSRLERIRRNKRYAIDIRSQQERSVQVTTITSPSTSSLSSLATPSSNSFPFNETKRCKDSINDSCTPDRIAHLSCSPLPRKTPIEEIDKLPHRGRRRSWEQNISKQRATTMYWLNNQTTDHFSIDSTDSDPNYLVEQSIIGSKEMQDCKSMIKENIVSHQQRDSASNIEGRETTRVSSQKAGLQRQYSEMKEMETDFTTNAKNEFKQIQNESNHQKDRTGNDGNCATKSNPTMFKSIVMVASTLPSKVHVLTPKAKANKTTQVHVDEILQETDFLSVFLNLNIRKRKRYLKTNVERSTTKVDNADIPNRARSFSDGAIYGQHHDDLEDEYENYCRQSTIDSGIAEEKQNKIEAIRFQRNTNRISLRQNGHTKVHRRPYQGHIDLDPKLIMSGSNTDSQSDENDQKKSLERRRVNSHGGSTSFSDSEIASFDKRKRRKRRKFGSAVKLSSCVTKFRHARVNGIKSSVESPLKESSLPGNVNEKQRTRDCETECIEYKKPCVMSAKSERDTPSSYLSDISIGVDDEGRCRLLHLSENTPVTSSGRRNSIERDVNDVMVNKSPGDISRSSHVCSPKKIFYSSKEMTLSGKQDQRYVSAICHYVGLVKQDKKYTSSMFLQPGNDTYLERTRDQMNVDFGGDIGGIEEQTDEVISNCTAEGVGLTTGQVGMKNNFQVIKYIFLIRMTLFKKIFHLYNLHGTYNYSTLSRHIQ